MAAIIASRLDSVVQQVDGRNAIVEVHTDDLGLTYQRRRLADDNGVAALAAYAVQIVQGLTSNEIDRNVNDVAANGSLATPSIRWSTLAANLSALRARYLAATQTEAIMIGDWLSAQSNAALQSAFGLTAGQVTTLRANFLTPAASAAATIRAAVGT